MAYQATVLRGWSNDIVVVTAAYREGGRDASDCCNWKPIKVFLVLLFGRHVSYQPSAICDSVVHLGNPLPIKANILTYPYNMRQAKNELPKKQRKLCEKAVTNDLDDDTQVVEPSWY